MFLYYRWIRQQTFFYQKPFNTESRVYIKFCKKNRISHQTSNIPKYSRYKFLFIRSLNFQDNQVFPNYLKMNGTLSVLI